MPANANFTYTAYISAPGSTSPVNIAQTSTTGVGSPTSGPLTGESDVRIVPKGLRSFDRDDADFFLGLLPGPRDRSGIPDDVRFWKTRIQDSAPETTFRVGIIYGPSGSGKSSFLKAGVIPQLSDSVQTIYVESTPQDTEARLLNALKRACPE